jgi:TPR repeat protein
MYLNGWHVPQDYAEAAKWYRLAAEQGIANAGYDLGLMYIQGEGVPQDYAEAIKWFQRAAEQGHSRSAFNLGVIYAKGQGVSQDYVQAHLWFDLAARSTSNIAERDQAAEARDRLASRMTPVQIAEAERLARKGTESHAS